jgi:hypothetical protein
MFQGKDEEMHYDQRIEERKLGSKKWRNHRYIKVPCRDSWF